MGFYGRDRTMAEDGRLKSWIPKNKVHHFKTLFNRIKEEVGSYDRAREVTGLSSGNEDSLNKGKCSETTAKKIYNAYQKYCVNN